MPTAAELLKSYNSGRAFSSLEEMLTSRTGFGLVTASPLQRALCRLVQGLDIGDDLWADANVQEAFGGKRPEERPEEICILSGIRCGKSLFAACVAVWASQTCDLQSYKLGPGDIPRVSIVSLNTDVAKAVFHHLRNNVTENPRLRRLLLGDPTADSVTLAHPEGKPVEIRVVAGARAGGTLVARWSAGIIFDEAPRMVGSDEGAINLTHERQAVRHRMLPGATIMDIGSPWQPRGPVYDMFSENFGKPTRNLVVVKAPAWAMNPTIWTPEKVAQARADDPDAARTDVDAEFTDPETSLFSSISITNSTRSSPIHLPPIERGDYSAAMDPATRGNAWTFALCTKLDGRIKVAHAAQWVGTRAQPLRPSEVMDEIAAILQPYGHNVIITDQFAGDFVKDLGYERGLSIAVEAWTPKNKLQLFTSFAQKLDSGLIELPPNEQLTTDLLAVRKRVTHDGATINLPKTGDGRHSDYAPALVLAASRYLAEPAPAEPESEYDEAEEAEMIEEKREHERMFGEDDSPAELEHW